MIRRSPQLGVASPTIDRLDVFGLGTDNAVYHQWMDKGSWQPGFERMGGNFASPPAAISCSAGRIDVFAVGVDNAMYQKTWNGSWTEWAGLGGLFASPPVVVSWGANRIDVFGLGTGNDMLHRWFDGNNWQPVSSWEQLGGQFTSPPAAITLGVNRLDVFGLGIANGMFHSSFDGSWHGWEGWGGLFASGPCCSSPWSNHVDVFALGIDNSLAHVGWEGGTPTGWENWGGNPLTSSPSSTTVFLFENQTIPTVFALGPDNSVRYVSNQPGWGGSLDGVLVSQPVVISWTLYKFRTEVFGIGLDNSLYTRHYNGLQWDAGWVSLGGIFTTLT